jgi:hypothetical protein
MTTVSQLLAVRDGVKTRDADTAREIKDMLQANRRGAFEGETRRYEHTTDRPDIAPRQSTGTQITASAGQLLTDLRAVRTRAIDVTLTLDKANEKACADLVVDGELIGEKIPAITLLALERYADEYVAIVKGLPVLDPSEKWDYDENAGCHRTGMTKIPSTSKETVPLTLWEPDDPATSKHAPQVKEITKDIPVGEWQVTRFSSALKADRKRALLERAIKFQEAVKFAREEANRATVTDSAIGKQVFDFLLAE